jgi:hypothetical protein
MVGTLRGVEAREETSMETAHNPRSASTEAIVDAAARRLAHLLGLRDCWFEAFPFDVQLPRIEPGRIVLPAAEPGVKRWQFGAAVELPVRLDGLTLGRFILVPNVPTCGVALSANQRANAIAMAGWVAPAIADVLRQLS